MKNYDVITTVIGIVIAVGSSVVQYVDSSKWEFLELGNFFSRGWSGGDWLLLQ